MFVGEAFDVGNRITTSCPDGPDRSCYDIVAVEKCWDNAYCPHDKERKLVDTRKAFERPLSTTSRIATMSTGLWLIVPPPLERFPTASAVRN